MYEIIEGRLFFRYSKECVCVEPWGKDSLRVRVAHDGRIRENSIGALDTCEKTEAVIETGENTASITNGKIKAVFTNSGLTFFNDRGEELTGERWYGAPINLPRPRHDPLLYPARSWRELPGSGWKVEYRMNAYDGEQLYGLGEYQDGLLNFKGATLEMKPRNKQASVPFVLSSRGYGFLWNNPAIGRVTFASNYTQWEADATEFIDYWITAGDTPKEIERKYMEAVGRTPMMPDYAMGYWQCKLRYVTQEELLGVAREYHRRGIPLKVIVIDFCHWTAHGNWYLDPACWPDPEAMCKELKEMGIELCISVWPSVEPNGDSYAEMREKGYLTETTAGLPYGMIFGNEVAFLDATNPACREYVWSKIKKNYFDKGALLFWADCAEPEYQSPDFWHYSYLAGPAEMTGNIYPRDYARMFYEGEKAAGVDLPLSLIRCAWVGSQKYGALVWSGDIYATWEAFRQQIPIGQSMAIAGIPWWTTDIGGFMGGNREDPAYRELIIRWFQWAAYCPVMRMHGAREGQAEPGFTPPNEIWSYGDEAYEIMLDYINKREAMLPYIREVMKQAHETGDPAIRPLFYEFPEDNNAWNKPFEYMFGPDLLVAPVLEPGVQEIKVYLPAGADWLDERDGKVYEGGAEYMIPAPITSIPVLRRQ